MSRLQELLKRAKEAQATQIQLQSQTLAAHPSVPEVTLVPHKTDFQYNEKQLQFIGMGCIGDSVALTGAAGCGKTTSLKGLIEQLAQSSRIPLMHADGHKHLIDGTPGIVMISYTNKAVANMKKVLPKDLRFNCMTAHKLLEYEPEFYQVFDEKTQKFRNTMQFVPTRNKTRRLPADIRVLVIDEAPMMPVSLWNLVMDAMHTAALQVILLGDLQQLPPVFGKSIFIHAIQQGMPVIELTEVYRQALGSPIIRLATEIVQGKMIPAPKLKEFEGKTDKGSVKIIPWKKAHSDTAALKVMSKWLPEQIEAGNYNPESDMILTPYNKSFGTIEINRIVASFMAKRLEAEVWEVFSGIKKQYFRVGERVLYNKTEARITKIEFNKRYFGKLPRAPSRTMDYAGVESNPSASAEIGDARLDDVDFMLEAMNSHVGEDESASREASHIITLALNDLDQEVKLSVCGDINALDLAYAITVHKSQGSEYDKVFFITHQSQATMIFRELVYTAVTRAKNELVVVCEPNLFVKGVTTQRLPGNTAKEKLAAFDRLMEIERKRGIGNVDTEVPIEMRVCLRKGNSEMKLVKVEPQAEAVK